MTDAPRIRIEANPKWIRGFVHGGAVIDSRAVRNVWEAPYFPAWYVPLGDVRGELRENGSVLHSPRRGDGTRYDLVVAGQTVATRRGATSTPPSRSCASSYDSSGRRSTRGSKRTSRCSCTRVVPRHASTPSDRRVTCGCSSKAKWSLIHSGPRSCTKPVFRRGYYLPKTDVRMDLLRPTDSTSACPYKGFARLLGRGHRRTRAPRHGVGLPHSAPRVGKRRGPRVLLQRACRHRDRRRTGRTAQDEVQLTVGRLAPNRSFMLRVASRSRRAGSRPTAGATASAPGSE